MRARARLAIRTGFKLGLVMALLLAAAVALGRWQHRGRLLGQPRGRGPGRRAAAWLAVYHLGDAAQALCVFVLRCYRVAIAPLVAYCLLLWGVGLAGGYALAYQGLGPWPAQALARGLLGRRAPSRSRCWRLILPAILWRAVRSYRG